MRKSCAFFLLGLATSLPAQQATANIVTAVPRLVRVSSSFKPADGQAAAAVEGVTLSIYRDEKGGSPLWQETQNVAVDRQGHYTALLGSTQTAGVPLELFPSGEPRWLGVQFQRAGEAEQPRVMMASVPYALKAVDAETLGGLPASAYMLSPSAPPAAGTPAGGTLAGTLKPGKLSPKNEFGAAGYLGVFTDSFDIGNSVMFQNGTKIGLGTTAPADFLHVVFSDTSGGFTGYAVQNLGSGANSYAGMLFYDQNGALGQFQGFNNSSHEYRINNVAANGSINFMLKSASKLQVRSDGDIDIPGSIRKNGTLFLHNLGSSNTALGVGALISTAGQSGGGNTAIGTSALASATSALDNVALGGVTLSNDSSGSFNTAVGLGALEANTTGSHNIAIGYTAGADVLDGSNNILIGANLNQAHLSNTIAIGDGANQTSAFISGIRGVKTGKTDAVAVLIDSTGQLGTVNSSRRFKEDIHDMGEASANLMRLRPVTYRYKEPYADGSKPIDYGLIAEEVEDVYPDLVVKSADGQVQTVQYHKLTPMLLNEVQQEHRETQQQGETIRILQEQNRQLQKRVAELQKTVEALISATAADHGNDR